MSCIASKSARPRCRSLHSWDAAVHDAADPPLPQGESSQARAFCRHHGLGRDPPVCGTPVSPAGHLSPLPAARWIPTFRRDDDEMQETRKYIVRVLDRTRAVGIFNLIVI